LDKDTADTEAANKADVDAARKRLSDLAGKAKDERAKVDLGKPEGLKSPDEVLGKLKNQLAGMLADSDRSPKPSLNP